MTTIISVALPCIALVICVYLLVDNGIHITIDRTNKEIVPAAPKVEISTEDLRKIEKELEDQRQAAANDAVKKINEFMSSGGPDNGK